MLDVLHPAADLGEAVRLEMVQPVAALPFFPDKARLTKNSQMFRSCRAAQLQQSRELSRRPRPMAEFVENDAPCRVGDSAKYVRKHRTQCMSENSDA